MRWLIERDAGQARTLGLGTRLFSEITEVSLTAAVRSVPDLKQTQSVKFIPHNSVTLTGGFLKPRAVLDGYVTS